MASWSPSELLARLRRGARDTVGRDEFDPRITADSILFTVGVILILLFIIVLAALVVGAVFERPTTANHLLLTLPFIVFFGTVVTTWEVLRYRYRPDRTEDDPDDHRRFVTPGTSSGLDLIFLIVSITLGAIAAGVVLQLIELVT